MKHHQSGFGSVALIAILAIVLIGGTTVYLSQAPQESDKTPEVSQEIMNESDNGSRETGTEEADDSMVAADMNAAAEVESGSGADLDGYLLIGNETDIDGAYLPRNYDGEFINHTPGDYSYAEAGHLVLFFHADWCPSCRALENDINANLSQIPDGVSIQKVDYDSATELKKQHGVVRQHTLVQVDADGAKIKTLTGLNNTLDQVVSQL